MDDRWYDLTTTERPWVREGGGGSKTAFITHYNYRYLPSGTNVKPRATSFTHHTPSSSCLNLLFGPRSGVPRMQILIYVGGIRTFSLIHNHHFSLAKIPTNGGQRETTRPFAHLHHVSICYSVCMRCIHYKGRIKTCSLNLLHYPRS